MSALSTFPLYFLLLLQQYYNKNTPIPFKVTLNQPLIQVGLDYKVDPKRRTNITITADKVIKGGSPERVLSFDDLTHIDDSQYLKPLDSMVYRAFPQSINLVDTYQRLVHKESIEEHPETRAPEFLAISRSVCNPLQPKSMGYDFIVLVQSLLINFDKRQRMREFYKSHESKNLMMTNGIRYAFVFSVGLPVVRSDFSFRRGETTHNLREKKYGGATNVKGYERIMRLLSEEINRYDDIVVGNYEDTFWNETLKVHHSFAWASLFCNENRPTFLLTEDNKQFNVDKLTSVLNAISKKQRETLFNAVIYKNFKAERAGIWFTTKTEVPWALYPDFPSRHFTIMGYETVRNLTIGMYFTRHIPWADTYIGLIATRMRLNLQKLENLIEGKELHLRLV